LLVRLLLASLLILGCRPNRDLSQYVQEDPNANITARLSMADAKHESQLKEGFHNLEENRWRWAAGTFKVELRTPFASQKQGATLKLQANLPEIVLAKTGPIQLTARIQGTSFQQTQYKQAGPLLFSAEVPAALCNADSVLVEFSTSKSLPPNTFPGDGRELALIIESITLETKP
jgi:hypothetical protein